MEESGIDAAIVWRGERAYIIAWHVFRTRSRAAARLPAHQQSRVYSQFNRSMTVTQSASAMLACKTTS